MRNVPPQLGHSTATQRPSTPIFVLFFALARAWARADALTCACSRGITEQREYQRAGMQARKQKRKGRGRTSKVEAFDFVEQALSALVHTIVGSLHLAHRHVDVVQARAHVLRRPMHALRHLSILLVPPNLNTLIPRRRGSECVCARHVASACSTPAPPRVDPCSTPCGLTPLTDKQHLQ